MLLPINWLKELIDINEDVNVIAEKLIEHSCEIDEIINQKKKFDHVIVGKITKIDKHPDADKLVVCQVTTGSKQYQIVTGATNVFEGAIIPVALDGADLPNGVQIKNSKLRGVDSNGMLCSETELGLSDEAKGIMILKDNPAIGTPIADYLQMNDQLLDVSITPNRGDLLSIKGLAREIAAIFKKNTNEIDITYSDKTKHDAPLKVINESSDLCARYMGVVIKGIKVAPSPEWMQKKLKQVNIKPISNIVDITNYVLYECGQPLHAFSYEKVKDSTIIVRRANNGETIKALNDQKVELTEKDLVITDKNGPVALAGIIGGVESAIHEDTTDIILESASFDPSNIRKSSFLKGIRTEASQRFEKGVDFQNVEFSFKRAIKLILEICGGHIASDICDVYEKEPQTVTLQLRPDRVNSLLGTEISKAEMINILTRLGFDVKNDIITVPSWRAAEVNREADIIEEIGRIYGYNNIELKLPAITNFEQPTDLSFFEINKKIREFFTLKGNSEIVSYSMVSPDEHPSTISKKPLAMKNPLTSSESVLRTNLFVSLIKNCDYNNRHLVNDLNTFEIGKIYYSENELVKEELHAGALFSSSPLKTSTTKTQGNFSFNELKGVSEELLSFLGIKQPKFYTNDIYEFLHPGKSAKASIGKDTLAVFGEVHPDITKLYGIKNKLYFLEIMPENITKYKSDKKKYKKFSLYPTVRRDLSFWIDKNVTYDQIVQIINKAKSAYLKDIILVDIYDGKKYGDDKINFAVQLVFQDPEKTLEEETVNQEFKKIVESITKLDLIFG